MTQLNPSATEEKVPAGKTTRAGNTAFRVSAILFGGNIAATVFLLFMALQSSSWQIYAMTGVLTVVNAIYFAALRMIRKGRLETGGWMLITAVLIGILTGPFLISGSGVILGFIFVAVTYLIVSQTLQAKYVRQLLAVSIGIGILVGLTDFLNLAYRLQAPALQAFTPIIAVVVLLPAGFFILRGAWSRSFTISRKLYIAFGILLTLGLVIAASGLFGLNRVQDAYENTLAGGVEIDRLSDHVNGTLLEARRREKDFLLRWQTEGFETAYENYVVLHQQHTAEMKNLLAQLGALAPAVSRANLPDYSQTQFEADIASMNEGVLVYEQSFANVVALIEERGFVDTGLEGEFRTSVQAIEAQIYDREGLDQLVITMLQIRRREKDYLLRGDQEYVDNVHGQIAHFKTQVAASAFLTSSEKAEIRALADEYLVGFDGLVAKDKEVADAIEVFRAAAADIQDSTERLESAGEQLAELDVQTAQANSAQTTILTGISALIVLIASIALALVLSRQITQPVLLLTNTAREIATGRFDVQAEVSTADEIGTLAQTFNTMTERLGVAFEDVRRRASELATVAEVSTATSTILDVKSLLQEVVDLTKERFNLYHSHIYLLDEAGANLVLASGAGEPGRVMVAERRSIPLDRQQSLVARAAREQKGVTVNDVTQAPDFLPNPLLPDTRSELAVPMIVGGNVIGVFDVQSDVVGRFTDSDINIQTTLAAQVATSIQNVRSFEQSKKQAEFESIVNVIGQRIQRTTSIEETLQTAIRELGTAVGASRVKANISARKDGSNN